PDVALLVLRVEVEGLLEHGGIVGRDVVHDRGRNAEDDLRLVRDGYGVSLGLTVLDSGVDELPSHGKREVGIVDHGYEVRRIEDRRVGRAARRRTDSTRRPWRPDHPNRSRECDERDRCCDLLTHWDLLLARFPGQPWRFACEG